MDFLLSSINEKTQPTPNTLAGTLSNQSRPWHFFYLEFAAFVLFFFHLLYQQSHSPKETYSNINDYASTLKKLHRDRGIECALSDPCFCCYRSKVMTCCDPNDLDGGRVNTRLGEHIN